MKKPLEPLTRYHELEQEKEREKQAAARCRPVKVGLDAILKKLLPSRGSDPMNQIQQAREIWREAAGEEIARHSTPTRWREGVLTVVVDAAPLTSQLQSFSGQALVGDLIGLGLEGLHTIRFQTGNRPNGLAPGEGRET